MDVKIEQEIVNMVKKYCELPQLISDNEKNNALAKNNNQQNIEIHDEFSCMSTLLNLLNQEKRIDTSEYNKGLQLVADRKKAFYERNK